MYRYVFLFAVMACDIQACQEDRTTPVPGVKELDLSSTCRRNKTKNKGRDDAIRLKTSSFDAIEERGQASWNKSVLSSDEFNKASQLIISGPEEGGVSAKLRDANSWLHDGVFEIIKKDEL